MDRNVRCVGFAAALGAVALAIAFGPLFAGYLFAGLGLMLVIAFIGVHLGMAIRDWALGHGWVCPDLSAWWHHGHRRHGRTT